MRTLWLTSAALIVSAHFACAQTMSPAPAPTGAPNAPAETSPGMSPGNTASPSPSMAQPSNSGSMNNGAMSNGAMSNGSMSNGSMSNGSAMNQSSGMASSGSHHMRKMPADASAASYLQIAQSATQHHNKARADEALSRAETRLLTRSVPQSSAASPDQSPAITAITQARQALRAGDFTQASAEINTAMQHAHAWSQELRRADGVWAPCPPNHRPTG